MADTINPIINQYELRYGQPYLSGAHIVNTFASKPMSGIPYVMQGLPTQSCAAFAPASAPEPPARSLMFQSATAQTLPSQYGNASAPTSGVYTGVEDHC